MQLIHSEWQVEFLVSAVREFMVQSKRRRERELKVRFWGWLKQWEVYSADHGFEGFCFWFSMSAKEFLCYELWRVEVSDFRSFFQMAGCPSRGHPWLLQFSCQSHDSAEKCISPFCFSNSVVGIHLFHWCYFHSTWDLYDYCIPRTNSCWSGVSDIIPTWIQMIQTHRRWSTSFLKRCFSSNSVDSSLQTLEIDSELKLDFIAKLEHLWEPVYTCIYIICIRMMNKFAGWRMDGYGRDLQEKSISWIHEWSHANGVCVHNSWPNPGQVKSWWSKIDQTTSPFLTLHILSSLKGKLVSSNL